MKLIFYDCRLPIIHSSTPSNLFLPMSHIQFNSVTFHNLTPFWYLAVYISIEWRQEKKQKTKISSHLSGSLSAFSSWPGTSMCMKQERSLISVMHGLFTNSWNELSGNGTTEYSILNWFLCLPRLLRDNINLHPWVLGGEFNSPSREHSNQSTIIGLPLDI